MCFCSLNSLAPSTTPTSRRSGRSSASVRRPKEQPRGPTCEPIISEHLFTRSPAPVFYLLDNSSLHTCPKGRINSNPILSTRSKNLRQVKMSWGAFSQRRRCRKAVASAVAHGCRHVRILRFGGQGVGLMRCEVSNRWYCCNGAYVGQHLLHAALVELEEKEREKVRLLPLSEHLHHLF